VSYRKQCEPDTVRVTCKCSYKTEEMYIALSKYLAMQVHITNSI